MPDLPGFKIYSSKSNDQVAVRNDVLQGNKSWEYVIIPQAPGKERIPDLKFFYFSPTAKQYREATAQGLEVAVLKGKGGGAGEVIQTTLQQGIVKRGSDTVVVLDATTVRVHPPQPERGLGAAVDRRFAVDCRG